MSQLKLIFIGILSLNEVYAASKTIHLTQKMYDDLITQEYINFIKETDQKVKDGKVFEELGNITDPEDSLKIAKVKYPAVYTSITQYSDTLFKHTTQLSDFGAIIFYYKYINAVDANLNPYETNLKDSFVKFMKIVIPLWINSSELARDCFSKEFPDIAKILNDKNIQAMVDGDKSITIETSTSKKADKNQPKKSVWQTYSQMSQG